MKSRLLATVAILLSVLMIAPAAGATGSSRSSGAPTLAEILVSDSAKDNADGFDRRSWDYDIVTQALIAVAPDLVDAAGDPGQSLTAFLPRDGAFRRLVYEITGQWIRSEADVFAAVAGLDDVYGPGTVRAVLEYHIVPAKISYRDALRSDGAVLTTLGGGELEVDVKRFWRWRYVKLIDGDTNDRDARVVRGNIGGEAANGFAHGINRVMRPIDLP